ncbi:hypothetical protein FB451DRAFT_1077050 [Mycena latifolia]|nr:hypothetical protein FB451DRAFT_1077050 [Mycena latifolia]
MDSEVDQQQYAQLVQSPDVWFDDGTVVLQAEKTLFRVYRGVLAAQSPIFSDTFAIPQPPKEDLYEGCPLVVLHDSPQDLTLFLSALHDAGYFVKYPVTKFSTLSALLRLATKYDVDHLRTRMISLLTAIYPSSFSQWLPRRLPPGYKEVPDDDFLALTLASTHNIGSVLPGIYYECCRYPTSELLDDYDQPPISPSDKRKCILATENYADNWSRRIHAGLFRINNYCASQAQCDAQRLLWIQRHGLPKFENILFQEFDWRAVGLCAECTTTSIALFCSERAALWDNLPSFFDLPPWEELLEGESTVSTPEE